MEGKSILHVADIHFCSFYFDLALWSRMIKNISKNSSHMLDFHEFTDVSKIMKIKHSEEFFFEYFSFWTEDFWWFYLSVFWLFEFLACLLLLAIADVFVQLVVFYFFLVLSLLFSCLVIALLLHKQKLFSNEIDDSTIFLAQGLLFYYTFTQQATYRTKKYPSKSCNERDERCTIFHEKYQYIMKKIKKPIFHNDPSMGNESGFI